MKEVTVDRKVLLKKLKVNRAKHVKTFEKAYENYVKTLKARVKKIAESCEEWDASKRSKRKFDLDASVNLNAPQSYECEYNTVVEMTEMSVDDTVTLSQQEFKYYIQDEWGWKHSFSSMASNYSTLASQARQ